MFEAAIQQCLNFTRPIHSIVRYYGSTEVEAGTATLFFVNSDGWAITCKHVADLLLGSEQLGNQWANYQKDLNSLSGTKKKTKIIHDLARKYNLKNGQPIRIKNSFINCTNGQLKGIDIKTHPQYDLALLKFDPSILIPTQFAKFPKSTSLLPGKVLCRLGYPFPQFSNFHYDTTTDDIDWNNTGRSASPPFPLDGMVTRILADENQTVHGFEVSTPGLRGQSGGPAFDKEGLVWGIQSSTAHLYLGFDVEQTIMIARKKEKIKDRPFMHVGHCVHVDVLKSFMQLHQVTFTEV